MALEIIGVIGGTGSQGGGLVRKILDDPDKTFAVRVFTRDPSKANAQKLKDAGAEVVAFDLNKPEEFEAAFQGLTGLFVVTNFFEHFSADKETADVKAVVEAAEKAGVKQYVWSTLEATSEFYDSLDEADRPPKISEGYYVPHFDGKGNANKFFPIEKTTFLHTSAYFENLLQAKNGVICYNIPADFKFPVIAVGDIGKSAFGIFKAGDKYKGQSLYISAEPTSYNDVAKVLSEVTGKEFKYVEVDRATFASFGFPAADDIANMFDFNVRNKDFVGKRDPVLTKELNPELLSIREWAEAHKDQLTAIA